MDAKSKANFIISVANGQVIPCPVCGGQNTPNSKFCVSCGKALAPVESVPAEPTTNMVEVENPQVEEAVATTGEPTEQINAVESPVDKTNDVAEELMSSVSESIEQTEEVETPSDNATPAFQTVADESVVKKDLVKTVSTYNEPESVFADGLPAWDIVPPQVMVRRRR